MSEQIYTVVTKRLWDMLGGDFYNPWGIDQLQECDGENSECYSNGFGDWSAEQHQQRINWLKNRESALVKPISIDFVFHRIGGAEMVIEDGNHRFFAHMQLKKPTIFAYFGGFVDVLEYLTGDTDVEPVLEELWV